LLLLGNVLPDSVLLCQCQVIRCKQAAIPYPVYSTTLL